MDLNEDIQRIWAFEDRHPYIFLVYAGWVILASVIFVAWCAVCDRIRKETA